MHSIIDLQYLLHIIYLYLGIACYTIFEEGLLDLFIAFLNMFPIGDPSNFCKTKCVCKNKIYVLQNSVTY